MLFVSILFLFNSFFLFLPLRSLIPHSTFLFPFFLTMSSSPSPSLRPSSHVLTILTHLLAEKSLAFASLSYSERQLTKQCHSISDVPILSRTPSVISYNLLIQRILTHIHYHYLSPVPSLSFHVMSSSSHSSSSSSVLPPPRTSSPSHSSSSSLLPLLHHDDPRTLRRLHRQTLLSTDDNLSRSAPPPSCSPPFSSATTPFPPPAVPRSEYPSPPLLPHYLPAITPSPLTVPSISSSLPVTMAHPTDPSSSSSFSFSTPRLSSVSPSHPAPFHDTSLSTSPVFPPPSSTPTDPLPSSSQQPPLLPLHTSQESNPSYHTPDVLQPDPTHITTDEIQRETHTSGILRTEFTNFPRISDNQLTERLVTSLLEHLAKQLSIDSSHTQNCREAQCIRTLRTSFHWR